MPPCTGSHGVRHDLATKQQLGCLPRAGSHLGSEEAILKNPSRALTN